MNKYKLKSEHYSTLKLLLRLITLVAAIWALVVAYRAESLAKWVNSKQDNAIERIMFPGSQEK